MEGIDQELAKYAQLKDLEKAYHPTAAAASVSSTAADPCISSSSSTNRTTIPNDAANFHLQRNPDGASNPDLNCKPTGGLTAASASITASSPNSASINGNCVPLPLRRSPGNGRSGSEPEEEFERLPQQQHNNIKNNGDLASDGNSMTSRTSSSIPSKSSPSGCSSMSSSSGGGGGGGHSQPNSSSNAGKASIMHRPSKTNNNNKRRDERTVLGKSQSTDTSSDIEIWQKPKQQQQQHQHPPIPEASAVVVPVKNKIPKFSRLFKLSRSPLKVIKDESKLSRRSKSADSRGKEAAAPSTMTSKQQQQQPQQQPQKDKKSSQSKLLRMESKRISSSANSLKQPSKNAKGTSSSVGCSTTTMTTKITSASEAINNRNNNNSSIIIPKRMASPYSVPTAPVVPFKTVATASTASSGGSGYDSGHDSGIVKSKFIKTCTFVKLRSKGGGGSGGRGASSTTTTNSSKNSSSNLLASKRTSERKSSGYESSSAGGVDSSERDSIDSLKGLASSDEGATTSANKVVHQQHQHRLQQLQPPPSAQLTAIKKFYHGLEPLDLLSYDENFIQRLDERWRLHEVRRLQQQQQELKVDLTQAKTRIGADKSKWSFGLHVADSVRDGLVASTDPSILEALQKETSILGKRVEAAKSHAVLTTSFDVSAEAVTTKLMSSRSSGGTPAPTCCTTDCEAAEVMILSSSSNETEIF